MGRRFGPPTKLANRTESKPVLESFRGRQPSGVDPVASTSTVSRDLRRLTIIADYEFIGSLWLELHATLLEILLTNWGYF